MKVFNTILITLFLGNIIVQLLFVGYNSESLTSYKYQLSDYEETVGEWPSEKQENIQRIISMRRNQIPLLEYNNKVFVYNLIFSVFAIVVLIVYQVILKRREVTN